VLGLTGDGTPVMQFLDDAGVPTFTAPTSMHGSGPASRPATQAEPPAEG